MSPFRTVRLLVPAIIAGASMAPALAGAQAQNYGTIFFKTNVGSFKILGVQATPAEGKITMTFTGTALINRRSMSDPKVTVSGNLRREYSNPQRLQEAYHGTGTLVIDGHFTSVQWFGRGLSGNWNGFGIIRLVGEFDNDLKTGTYWYSLNPNDIKEWGTQLNPLTNPPGKGDVKLIPQARGAKPPQN